MKVTFEQLKAAFNRVLISRGVDSPTQTYNQPRRN